MGIFKRHPPAVKPTAVRENLPLSIVNGRIESALDEAVRMGALDDVSGKGAPLPPEYLEDGQGGFLMNKVLKEQGFVPDWAVLGQAVDLADERLGELLAAGRDEDATVLLAQRNQLVRKLNAQAPSPLLQRGLRRLDFFRSQNPPAT